MYTLSNHMLTDNPTIVVVGCGGTGGYVSEGLCRLFTGREASIVLVDHDRVEPHNLLRQHFYAGDVGEFKAKVLAERLSRQYHRTIGYSIYPIQKFEMQQGRREVQLTIGCVDNPAARRDIASKVSRSGWWVDAGNGETWGQVLVGNVRQKQDMEASFLKAEERCLGLPVPTVQMPDLLHRVPEARPDLDCAAALDLTDQDPTINQFMSSLVLQVVRRLVAGTCPWMGLYLALDQGTVTPVFATPETAAKAMRVRVAKLFDTRCGRCREYHALREWVDHRLVPMPEPVEGRQVPAEAE